MKLQAEADAVEAELERLSEAVAQDPSKVGELTDISLAIPFFFILLKLLLMKSLYY